MTNGRMNDLLTRYFSGNCTQAEVEELAQMVPAHDDKALGDALREVWPVYQAHTDLSDVKSKQMLESILKPAGKPLTTVRIAWLRYAAAIILVAGFTTYAWFSGKTPPVQISGASTETVVPGGNKATLTLADGRTIILDSMAGGILAEEGATKILKLDDGALAYNDHSTGKSTEILYNTISTPKGGQYQISLPDGTKVWLNAASSIRFPVSFTGKERKVEIKGEAYFEVKTDPALPFFVSANETEVQVLGTSFNTNAYTGEDAVRTTLISGSVKIKAGSNQQLIKPGEQASYNSVMQKIDVLTVNTVQVTAWKNGLFNFEGATLEQVMRQLERWYDIDVVYEKGIPVRQFGGEMSRDLSLSDVLTGLQDVRVHFRLNGRRLTVMP